MCSTKTKKESKKLSGSLISVVWLFVLFVLNTAQSSGKKKIIGNVTAKNYLKESLSVIFCFIIQGKGSSWKGFGPEIYSVAIAYGNLTRSSFLSTRT